MFPEEARLKHRTLIADSHAIEHRSQWEQFQRFERLQRSIRVVRARLGLRAVTE